METKSSFCEGNISRIKLACQSVFGKRELQVQPLSGGYVNVLYQCSILPAAEPSPWFDSAPQEVVVRLSNNRNRFSIIGASEEAVVAHVFSERRLGPKLHAVLEDIRIEQFITGRILSHKDYENNQIYVELAQKLAEIHSLSVPINRDPDAVFQRFQCTGTRTTEVSTAFREKIGSYEIMLYEKILKFDLAAEVNWIKEMTNRIKSRVVFGHFDFHNRNLLLRPEEPRGTKLKDRIVVIDFELCAHFYRGYDFAAHFMTIFDNEACQVGEPVFLEEASESRKLFFIRAYLEEWKRRNPETFDPSVDTVDNIVLESRLFSLLRGMMIIILALESFDHDKPVSISRKFLLEGSLSRIKTYVEEKQKVIQNFTSS